MCPNRLLKLRHYLCDNAESDSIPTLFREVSDVGLGYTPNVRVLRADWQIHSRCVIYKCCHLWLRQPKTAGAPVVVIDGIPCKPFRGLVHGCCLECLHLLIMRRRVTGPNSLCASARARTPS